MPVTQRITFIPSEKPITQPVTKFGGKPVWLTEPQWPLSAGSGNPMQFIAQIALDPEIFPGTAGKVAYLFMTSDDDEAAETWDPDSGDNAVIIQPNGILHVPVAPLRHGPTLFEPIEVENNLYEPQLREFTVSLTTEEEQPLIQDDQYDNLSGNKIGGTPYFIQSEEYPHDQPENWSLLLQLDSENVPFYINFGDAGIGYAFINKAGTLGKFLWQCS